MDFTVEIGGEEVAARADIWALAVYEAEFAVNGVGADMLKDVFGRAKPAAEDGALDFTRTNWTNVAKAAWACIRSADPSTPPFSIWAAGRDISMFAANDAVSKALAGSFFRFGVAPETQEG